MLILIFWMVLLVMETYGGYLRKLPVQYQTENGDGDDSTNAAAIIVARPNDDRELSVARHLINLNVDYYDLNGEEMDVLKGMKHRNKRYTTYNDAWTKNGKRNMYSHRMYRYRHNSDLTLCPFKICNMGRKRTRSRRFSRRITTG